MGSNGCGNASHDGRGFSTPAAKKHNGGHGSCGNHNSSWNWPPAAEFSNLQYSSHNWLSRRTLSQVFVLIVVAALVGSSWGAETEGEHVAAEHEEPLFKYLTYFLMIYLFGSILALLIPCIFARCPVKLPVSIVWFTFGSCLALLGVKTTHDGLLAQGIRAIGELPADIIYTVLLPVLLYEGAVNTNWHKFEQMICASAVLAYLGVAFTAGVLAILFKISFSVLNNPNGWFEAALLGSAVASTDPVAVISVLKSLNAPEKLLSMFEGESLLNDGTSVALFQVFNVFALHQVYTGVSVVWLVFRLLFLGPMFGWLWSALACVFVQNFHGQTLFQIVFLLTNVYFAFFVGEHYFGLSGPLTAVFYGLYICRNGRRHLEPAAFRTHHHSIATLAALSESAIFIISGNVAFRAILQYSEEGRGGLLWGSSFIMYGYVMLARLLMFGLAYPYLKKRIYGFSWQELLILVWGGLRGAIVLALALAIEGLAGTHKESYRVEFANFAISTISTTVMIILLVNGTSFAVLFNLLNPYPCRPYKRIYLRHAMKQIDDNFKKSEDFENAGNWWVLSGCPIDMFPHVVKIVPELCWREVDSHGMITQGVPSIRKIVAAMKNDLLAIGTVAPQLGGDDLLNGKSESGSVNVAVSTDVETRRESVHSHTKCAASDYHGVGQRVVDEDVVAMRMCEFLTARDRVRSMRQDMMFEIAGLQKGSKQFSSMPKADEESEEEGSDSSSDGDVEANKQNSDSVRPRKGPVVPTLKFPLNMTTSPRDTGKKSILKSPGSTKRNLFDGTFRSLPTSRAPQLQSQPPRASVAFESNASDSCDDEEAEETLRGLSKTRAFTHLATLVEAKEFADMLGVEEGIEDLQKERLSEIFIMVCHALANKYVLARGEETLCGKALATLQKSLDIAIDYAALYPLLRENSLIKALLDQYPEYKNKINRRHWEKYRRQQTQEELSSIESAFEVEWQVLRASLSTQSTFHHFVKKIQKFMPRCLWSFHTCRAVYTDSQAIMAFVSAHEKVKKAGGEVLEHLLHGSLMKSYKQQISNAKAQLLEMQTEYPEASMEAILRTVGIDLINMKQHVIEELASSGILLHEDKETLLDILDEQRQRLVRWNRIEFLLELCRCKT